MFKGGSFCEIHRVFIRTLRGAVNARFSIQCVGQHTKMMLSRAARRGLSSRSKGCVDVHRYPVEKRNTALNICPQGNKMVVETLGKFSRTVEPGWFLAVPFIQRIIQHDCREMLIYIDPQPSITKDNVSTTIDGVVYVTVNDAYKASYGARRPLLAVQAHAQSSVRSVIGTMELDELLHNREKINDSLRSSILDSAGNWGLDVKRCEITDIRPDEKVSVAMDKQAVAERQRRETLLNADAERDAMIRVSEGYKTEKINQAEGDKARVVKEAEAKAESIRVEAEAIASATTTVGDAISNNSGSNAVQFELAKRYVEAIRSFGDGPNNNTIWMDGDINSTKSMLAKATGVIGAMLKPPVNISEIEPQIESIKKKSERHVSDF